MQHVICVKWTSDSKYIMCGSDEMNIRLWKANASEKLGVVRDPTLFHRQVKLVSNFIGYHIVKRIFLKCFRYFDHIGIIVIKRNAITKTDKAI